MDRTQDRRLVAGLQAGDQAAVQELAVRYGPRIQQLAMRHMKNREDAEEVTQDVLLKVHRKIHAFRGDAALSSWIYRITFNTAMSRLRTARFTRPAEVHAGDLSGAQADHPLHEPMDWSSLADDQVMRRELRTRLIGALTQLPIVYRIPVVLRDIHGLSTEEASAVLRVKPQTLKSRLHRGRLILRHHLGDFAAGLSLHEREAN